MSSAVAGPSKVPKPKPKPKPKVKAPAKTTAASKVKSKEVIDDEDDAPEAPSEPKYEGTNTGWAYEPPKGAILANHDIDAEEFDYDALKGDENLELWIVRVPDTIKPKHLESLKLDAPSSSVTGRMGSLERRSVHYDVWSLGDDEHVHVGGDELKNLTCLVPRKKKGGKLYAVPSSLPTRHVVISAQAVLPTPPPSSDDAEGSQSEDVVTYTNPPRPSYPLEALTHRYMPVGSLVRTSESDFEDEMVAPALMDVDDAILAEKAGTKEKKKKKEKTSKGHEDVASESKSKKRKVDESASPKKQKKVKTDAS